MDDAGGGVRGLRSVPTEELLAAVESAYGIGRDEEPVDLGGSSNLNLLVRDGDQRWVVRVYRPFVTTERLQDIHVVRHMLDGSGIPCDGLLTTRNRKEWIGFQGRLVEVERFVDRDGDMNSWNALMAGMPVLAALHDRLRGAPVAEAGRHPRFANYLSSTEALEATLRGVERIRGWDPSQSELELAADAERLSRVLGDVEGRVAQDLPRQLVHGDFWDNNVFMRDGSVVYVTDFDFMGDRPRIDDLALTLFFLCMRFFENPVSDAQLSLLRALVDSYDGASEMPLSAAERLALPAAIARQPLWSIGVWVRLLDDEKAARRHASATSHELVWALLLVEDFGRWQGAIA